jgi:hypothetical protein
MRTITQVIQRQSELIGNPGLSTFCLLSSEITDFMKENYKGLALTTRTILPTLVKQSEHFQFLSNETHVRIVNKQ